MRIRKNGKVITLSESDLRRIVKIAIKEQKTKLITESPLLNGGMRDIGLEKIRKYEPQIDELLKKADSNLSAGFGVLNSGNIYHWEPNSDSKSVGTFKFYNVRELNGLPITGQIGFITKRNVSNQIGKSNDVQDFSWAPAGVSAGGEWDTLKKDNGGNSLVAFSSVYNDMDVNLFNLVYKKVQQNVDTYKQAFANIAKETIDKTPTYKTINIEKNTLKSGTQSRKLYELFKYEPQQKS